MALSLADELAGFDDPPSLESGVTGGLSLAEEFGIDDYTDGDTGLNTQCECSGQISMYPLD